jgi:hypothetical protein
MSRHYFIYPVPQDHMMLLKVVNALQGDDETQFGWRRISASIVAVSSLTAAIYLRAVFEHRPSDIDGAPLLDDREVWIEDEDRSECERLLAENCPSAAAWFDLIEVSFANDDEHRSFGAAYTAITGLPNAFTPVPSPSK